ncbi:flagellar protein export ATPase FliI [Microvirga brassicacearum]|uniref:Flagellum-specific ATP synthase n=1 Tax=Microvirga brassicacearum TaxID=2580413 RepID=A0A5N3P3U5_9HYPH|nr:flagellar protein export ATPase FliI [Microvirga brassicacearum]KAB0264321.1 flagellar protein export ATPase FliI [Microvirga brassicacearum]
MNALETLENFAASEGATFRRVRISGVVREITAGYCRVTGLSQFVKLGDGVGLGSPGNMQIAEVVRVDDDGVIVKLFSGSSDTSIGMPAFFVGDMRLSPDVSWKGRIINALAEPLDDLKRLAQGPKAMSSEASPPSAMKRARVTKPLATGVRAIDLFTPICQGQRIGIFAGSGVGKSTLLSMLAKSEGFDTIVVALVGERGREVREFLDGPIHSNLHKSVMVVSTGDESPMMRRQAPRTAMLIAEYFRDRGDSVLLIVDSVTRYAHAARDVALAAGEPAVARGYPPSVFSDLPRLLERAGPGEIANGSITGIFSVLVDGDDHNDPVADNIRGTLDGHIVLDRMIADQGRYPAINVLGSISRLAEHVWTADQKELVRRLRGLIARFEDTRDLRLMGGYQQGGDAELDQAVVIVPKIYDALRQDPSMPTSKDAFLDLAQSLKH